tara:strand:- start:6105 stop:7391 length:1287 start_codon:yes stop_codon:yes gene_type:complete
MSPNPMDRNTGGLGYNKNIAQVHSMLVKMPDSYLSKLIQDESPFATVATMVLDTRQGAAQSAVEPPTSTVADKVASQVGGIPSVAPQQNNQDPRLMEGVGGMALTEKNSVDTPMTGVAQLPAEQMMADGGIVGYQEGGEVEPATFFGEGSDKLRYIRENPFEAASYGLLAVPGAGLAGLGLRAAGRYALPKIASGARKLFTRPGKRELAGFQAYREGPRTLRKLRTLGTASGVAGLGGLIASSDFSGGEEEPKANKTLPDMSGISNFDKDGFMKTLFRQGQLTGKNIATDATGQGLLASGLGGFAKATGDLAASDEAQENKLEQLGVSANAKSRVTPANRLKVSEMIDERILTGVYDQEAINAVAAAPAEAQALLRANGIVANDEKTLIDGMKKLLAQQDTTILLNQISGATPTLSTAGYSVAPSTTG